MKRHDVQIESTGPGAWSIKVDGTEIADGVARGSAHLNLGGRAGKLPTLSLDLLLWPGARVFSNDTRIDLPESTRKALIALGWTPPDGDQP